MRRAPQDLTYLNREGDAFFQRNHSGATPEKLRDYKRRIADQIEQAGIRPRRMIELGCCYGDLVHHYATQDPPVESHGVEASGEAVAFGNKAYGDAIRLSQGTIADNPYTGNEEYRGRFDLVVVDDVFCWVSRETLMQSVTNIDDLLADGGYIYIREFRPLTSSRNINHHIDDQEVFCYKLAAGHAAIFQATGIYEPVFQRVYSVGDDQWAQRNDPGRFETRWVDIILRKSYGDYYQTNAKR